MSFVENCLPKKYNLEQISKYAESWQAIRRGLLCCFQKASFKLNFLSVEFFCASPFYPVQLDSILENFFKILVICFNSKQTVLKAFWECCKILSIKIWMLQKVFWEAARASGPARTGGCWCSSSWTTPWCPPSPSASLTPGSPLPRTRGTSSMRRW